MSNFRTIDRETGFLLPPSVDEWLPEKHLARFVVEVVDGLDLRAMSGSYRGSGSASYHPRMLLGLLVYGYATGVFSSRKLERATYDSVAFRFIAANDHPDHDTIATFKAFVAYHMTDIDWRPTDGYDAFGVMQRGTPLDFFRAELAGGGAVHIDPSIATFVVVPRTLGFAACAAETGVTRDQVVRWRREALLRDARQIPDAYCGSVIVYPRGTCAQIRAAKADDFYQRLIIHRNVIKAKLDDASEADKPALKSDEQGIKILANQGRSVLWSLIGGRGFPPAKMSESIGDNPNRRLSHAGIAAGGFAHHPRPSSRRRQAVRSGHGVAVRHSQHGRWCQLLPANA